MEVVDVVDVKSGRTKPPSSEVDAEQVHV